MSNTTSASSQPQTETLGKSAICPQCERANLLDAHFCTNCHHILIYRCPMCWNEQRHGGTCDKCHLDLEKYWRISSATGRAALIQEEETNMEKSANRVNSFLTMIATIPLQLIPFLEFVGISFVASWLRRRFPD
jgi:hypothetical protein